MRRNPIPGPLKKTGALKKRVRSSTYLTQFATPPLTSSLQRSLLYSQAVCLGVGGLRGNYFPLCRFILPSLTEGEVRPSHFPVALVQFNTNLGVELDSQLSFKAHITAVTPSCRFTL